MSIRFLDAFAGVIRIFSIWIITLTATDTLGIQFLCPSLSNLCSNMLLTCDRCADAIKEEKSFFFVWFPFPLRSVYVSRGREQAGPPRCKSVPIPTH